MYAICNTSNKDAKKCIDEMKKRDYRFPLYQVGVGLYKKLEADQIQVPATIRSKTAKYAITLRDAVLHKAVCKKVTEENSVPAYLVRPSRSGLRMCSCMK